MCREPGQVADRSSGPAGQPQTIAVGYLMTKGWMDGPGSHTGPRELRLPWALQKEGEILRSRQM